MARKKSEGPGQSQEPHPAEGENQAVGGTIRCGGTGQASTGSGVEESGDSGPSRRARCCGARRGARGWLLPIMESAYSRLVPRGQAVAALPSQPITMEASESALRPSGEDGRFKSLYRPGLGEEALAPVNQNLWLEHLGEYRSRVAAIVPAAALAPAFGVPPSAPAIPGQKNWNSLGPSVVVDGQAQGLPPIGGRSGDCGGAWGDGHLRRLGQRRRLSLRRRHHDLAFAHGCAQRGPDELCQAPSLACGAIAIDHDDPERIFVGTGEGDTNTLFNRRITNALPAYRGIGPIRSDNGGKTWEREVTAAGSPELAGKAFFALAINPVDREDVIGATTEGLYQRVTRTGGKVEWVQRRPGVHPSVKVAYADGATHFIAAEWGRGVFQSADGVTWTELGKGLPTSDVGRIALGVQPDDLHVVYALVTDTKGALKGVFRLDGLDGSWKKIANPPDVLPTDTLGNSQGDYDLAIAVNPRDASVIYLGGSYYADQQYWPASVWRCRVKASGSGYRMTADPIGVHAHADVHVLVHTPGNPDELWVGCDGGIFVNRDPRNSDNFASRNNGLACLCTNFFGQHPTDPNILLCGLQDNGTARSHAGPIWKHVNWGDGGYCLVNWADTQQVLVFANGTVYRATDGGQDHDSWTVTADAKTIGWALMTEPIVGPPYNPAKPAEASLVALGVGRKIYLSQDFGRTWPISVDLPGSGAIFSLAFASVNRFFAGTTVGEVFRLDHTSHTWKSTRLDNVTAGALGLQGLIADIAIDWADSSHSSIYVAFGGMGDYRHVWHFDGTLWAPASGAPGSGSNNLLDVEHNALVVEPASSEQRLRWRRHWSLALCGSRKELVPDGQRPSRSAPVFDLQTHPARRLLRKVNPRPRPLSIPARPGNHTRSQSKPQSRPGRAIRTKGEVSSFGFGRRHPRRRQLTDGPSVRSLRAR